MNFELEHPYLFQSILGLVSASALYLTAKVRSLAKTATETHKTGNEILAKTIEIHVATDGQLTDLQKQLEHTRLEVNRLSVLVTRLECAAEAAAGKKHGHG